jgi:putative oxidoreductase
MLPASFLILGRILLGGLFVFAGIRHMFLIAPITGMIASRGVPFPKLVLLAGSAFQFIAGALLVLGIYVAPAALGLAAFTLAASVMLLNVWSLPEGTERQIAVTVWPCNIAIIGGLLVTAATAM